MRAKLPAVLLGGAGAFLLCIVAPGSTGAFTVSTLLTQPCHEQMTAEALRTVRLDLPTAAPMAVTVDEQALVDDVQFTLDPDMRDLGAVALLVSVRDNDLKGRSSDDLTQLAEVHGNPDTQQEHCLRTKDQDEPGGSEAALNACREFIRGRVEEALDALDANGFPDGTARTALPLYLSFRGGIAPSLPTYYVRIGQAIHAVEDSFSHTYRTPDGMSVTVVLNWVDEVNGTLDEVRDGPAHASLLDVCNDPDDLRTTRHRLATEAAVAILRATLDPQKTKDEKMAATDGILDKYMSYSPGCTFDNNWCDAAERTYKAQGSTVFGCSSAGAGLTGGFLAVLALIGLSRRRRRMPSVVASLMVVGAIALVAGSARADESPQPVAATAAEPAAPATPDPHAPPPPVTVPVPAPGPADPSEGAWGAYLAVSGSVDKPAFAVQVGIRRRLSTHWTIGLDVEENPWISVNGPTAVRAGVLSAYATAILRFPLAYEDFNLRTTVNLGASYLLIDLYGAPKGSVGLYGAIYPVGLEWKMSRYFLLIINPLGFALPAPQLKGVPLIYPQYRFSIGLGILAG